MIVIHEGNPGSGKSYDAVRKIIDALKSGRTVFTNIDGLEKPRCREVIAHLCGITRYALETQLIHLASKQCARFWDIAPAGSFVVIDECHKFWSSRASTTGQNKDMCEWAAEHRHSGYDVLLITQRSTKIDVELRSIADFRYFYRKINVFGSLVQKKYLVFTYLGDEKKSAFKPERRTYDLAVFAAYNSYVGDSTEKKVFKTPNILAHPIFIIFALVLIGFLWSFSKSSFATGDPLGYKANTAKFQSNFNKFKDPPKPAAASPDLSGIAAVGSRPSAEPVKPELVPGNPLVAIQGFSQTAKGRVILIVAGRLREDCTDIDPLRMVAACPGEI